MNNVPAWHVDRYALVTNIFSPASGSVLVVSTGPWNLIDKRTSAKYGAATSMRQALEIEGHLED